MRRTGPILAICALAALAAGCCRRQACGSAAPVVALSRLAAKPASFAGRPLTVKGVLNNAGSNYFTDLKLVLSDGGSAVAVLPWLPLEVPPRRPGAAGDRPAVLSDYLGKQVKITGSLRKDGEAYSIEVQQADIIAEESK
jgi:hypothetical protein